MFDLESGLPRAYYSPVHKIAYFLFVAYLIFLPFGSYPVSISGVKLDNLVGVILFFLTFFSLCSESRLSNKNHAVTIFGAVYMLVLYISVLHSPEIYHSIQRYVAIFGYAFVALFLPRVLHSKFTSIGSWALILSAFAAGVIWLSYLTMGMSSWGRMTIPTWSGGTFEYFPGGWGTSPDPNILGFGLMLSLFFGLVASSFDFRVKVFLSMLVTAAAVLTLSRTVLVSSLLALTSASVIVNFEGTRFKPPRFRFGPGKLIINLSAFLIMLVVLFFVTPLDQVFGRLSDTDGIRVKIYSDVFSSWMQSDKTAIFGVGFDMARIIQDPHNIYVTALHDSGIFGVTALLVFMSSVFFSVVRIKKKKFRFGGLLIVFFIAFGGLFYWHTKTFWFAIIFTLLIKHYDVESSSRNSVGKAE